MSCSIKVRVLQDLEVDRVLVVRLEGNPVPVELLGEVFRLQFVPFVCRRSVRLILLEPLLVQLIPFIDSLVGQNALVGFNTKLLAIWSIKLVLDEPLVLSVSIGVHFSLKLLDLLIKVLFTLRLCQCYGIGLHPELIQVILDVLNSLLIV